MERPPQDDNARVSKHREGIRNDVKLLQPLAVFVGSLCGESAQVVERAVLRISAGDGVVQRADAERHQATGLKVSGSDEIDVVDSCWIE